MLANPIRERSTANTINVVNAIQETSILLFQ